MSDRGVPPVVPGLQLNEDEKGILKRQIHTPKSQMSRLWLLYTCATTYELFILAISSIAAIVGGALQPVSFLFLGGLAQAFKEFFLGTSSGSHLSSLVARFALYYVYIAIGQFVSVYISTAGFMIGGENITQRLREKYLAAILRQNIAFFDVLGAGEITTRITADMNLIQDSLTGKLSLTLYSCANFGAAFIISFAKSWRMALILISAIVAETGSMSICSSFMVKYTNMSLLAYADGSTAAEEAISSIRHVTAFGIQDKLADRYQKFLTKAERYGLQSRIALATMMAIMNGVIFWTYGLTFWQGSRYLVVDEIELGALVTILLATLTGAFTFGNIAPNFQAFATGIAATGKILATVSRKSPLDPSSSRGNKLQPVSGTIELKNICFVYPSRPDVLTLDGINLLFTAGKTTAIVGASGCGKKNIVVMSHGRVVEQGTHNDLLEKRSVYYELVEKQRMSTERSIVISEAKSALDSPELTDLKDEDMDSKKYTYEMGQHRGAPDCEKDFEREPDREYSEYSLWALIKFIASFNKEETLTMIWGLFFSIVTGAGNPTQAGTHRELMDLEGRYFELVKLQSLERSD
ncbi:ABC transporter integral membrane type 1 [Penicillium vulpinum]|uniref:ABC transporter integral membrane type 1 n=1 Tax=Penicillium vulpinum TaxID=29845 RepID=UPI002546CA9E|nr:ABC transporter integral membrane type 1 [Penicillium vulpinum]KAJ5951225.1 ABC transporter integral membrane type 1 [Penicillium vulpinum]